MARPNSTDDPPGNVSPFTLQAQQQTSGDFISKTDSIFGSLGSLEQKYQSHLTERKDEGSNKRGHDDEDEDEDSDRGRFKKPSVPSEHSPRDRRSDRASDRRSHSSSRSDTRERDDRPWDINRGERRWERRGNFSRPPPRGRFQQPDHKLNPGKYTAYTLEDTSVAGEKANRSIALDFITELKKRKEGETAEEEGDKADCKNKIEFHKPKKEDGEGDDDTSGKRKNYGSVYRMSEYVVGGASSKKPKSKHHTTTLPSASDDSSIFKSNLPLDHLGDDDNDESSDSMDTTTEIKPGMKGQPPMVSTGSTELSANEDTSDVDAGNKAGVLQEGVDKEQTQFKFGKGKGKRKIRARQVDDD